MSSVETPRDGRTGRLTSADGLEIFWRVWPTEPARAVIVLAHGAGEHSGRYEHVGLRLAAAGYEVYALDHRGHGRSQGPRALIDRMASAVADLDALLELARRQRPELPVFLLGHSMGGTLALAYTLVHERKLTGLILSGPLASLDAAPAPVRALARVLSRVAPRAGLVAVDPGGVSRDPAVVSAYREDPLVFHGKLPARTIVELADAVAGFPDSVRRISLPTLLVHGTEDRIVPAAGTAMLGERLGSEDLTVIPYAGLYHEVFNEPEQEAVLDDVVRWLDAHAAQP